MNVSKFIAKRYFRAKKSKNIINLITIISIVGVAISTAAMVILLSAFNGIEDVVLKLYSDFDPSLTISAKNAKTFNENFLPIEEISNLDGVNGFSRAVEEVVILKHDQKWVHAKMMGVEHDFIEMSNLEAHIIEGNHQLENNGEVSAVFGALLLDKLDAYVASNKINQRYITFHVPLREGKLRPGKNPLSVKKIAIGGKMNFNREVNEQIVLLPLNFARSLLQYDKDITKFLVNFDANVNLDKAKSEVQKIVGDDFTVKTHFELNDLIYKTSQTERIIVYFILVFIFILSSFNLIASLTMLFIEKKQDIQTMISFGASKKIIFNIFFYEGIIISSIGVAVGLILGYIVVFSQQTFGFIMMPGSVFEHFPVRATLSDAFLICCSVIALGLFVSYLPTSILIKKIKHKF